MTTESGVLTDPVTVPAVPAIVAAGDSRAAKEVHGESKVFLELGGLSLVAHVVLALQAVVEVDSVWVVGNRSRLEQIFDAPEMRARLSKPLHLVQQKESLLANAWEAYRCILSGDSRRGRDPESDADRDREILFLSGDIPFATPQEISAFVQTSRALGAEYTCGLTTDEGLAPFRNEAVGGDGIDVAYFNLRDGRFRQNNLHYARPARIGQLIGIEEMYEHRHQQRATNMFSMARRVLGAKGGGLRVVFFYFVMHLSGWLDRWGWKRLSDALRIVTIRVNEEAVSALIETRFRFGVTHVGGCGIDIDNEAEYAASRAHYDRWQREQRERALTLHGPPGLPARMEGLPEAIEEHAGGEKP